MASKISKEERAEIADEMKGTLQKFEEAWEELSGMVNALGDRHAAAYLVEQLQVLIWEDTGITHMGMSIQSYIRQLEAQDEEDEE